MVLIEFGNFEVVEGRDVVFLHSGGHSRFLCALHDATLRVYNFNTRLAIIQG